MSIDPPNEIKPAHIQQQLLQLADSVNRIQSEVAALTVRLQQDSLQINALVRHLTDTQSTQLLQERLADFAEQMGADHEQLNYLAGRLGYLATQEQLVRLATQVATQEKVAELSATLEKLGRAQERANVLAQTKEQQLESALATLREIFTKREQQEEQVQARTEADTDALRRSARGELAADLLPALDMLETIAAEGKSLLEKRRAEAGLVAAAAAPESAGGSGGGSLLSKWRARMGGDMASDTGGENAGLLRRLPESMQEGLTQLSEWLQAVSLLQDRLLVLLRREGIEPIVALHQLFDPHLHLAVDREPRDDLAPQTVVRVVRKGYRQGARTLRHSEVIVAERPNTNESPATDTSRRVASSPD